MAGDGIDALLLSVGADLPYFTGYEAPPLERLTMAVIPAEGETTLVVPELEAPRVRKHPDVFAVSPWSETEDPVELVRGLVGDRRRLGVGDQTWAVFLLALRSALPEAEFVPAAPLTKRLRQVKDESEVAELAAAAAAADRVVARLREVRFSGRSERELASLVQTMLIEEGSERAWDAIVGSGPNGASPHHEATGKLIEQGEVVVVDFGGTHGGYHSDTTRTFSVGRPSEEVGAAYAVLQVAQQAAFEAAQIGTPAQDVDRAARSIITEAGFGDRFVHRTGHGIGLEVHEHPYLVEGNTETLRAGSAFSIEPGIYQPGHWGMRIEDIVVLESRGPKRLNESRRDLAVVE